MVFDINFFYLCLTCQRVNQQRIDNTSWITSQQLQDIYCERKIQRNGSLAINICLKMFLKIRKIKEKLMHKQISKTLESQRSGLRTTMMPPTNLTLVCKFSSSRFLFSSVRNLYRFFFCLHHKIIWKFRDPQWHGTVHFKIIVPRKFYG